MVAKSLKPKTLKPKRLLYEFVVSGLKAELMKKEYKNQRSVENLWRTEK